MSIHLKYAGDWFMDYGRYRSLELLAILLPLIVIHLEGRRL